MSLSSLSSYSSDLGKNAKDEEDKWVDDEPSLLNDKKPTIGKAQPKEKAENDSSVSSIHSTHSVSQPQIEDLSSSSSRNSQKSKKQSSAPQSEKPNKGEVDTKQTEDNETKNSKQKASYGYHPSIEIALSGNKLAYNDGDWLDVSDLTELVESVHPIVAENINLQSRMKLLVRRIAEAEYESQLIQNEISECDTVIEDLKKVLETDENSTFEEDEEDTF